MAAGIALVVWSTSNTNRFCPRREERFRYEEKDLLTSTLASAHYVVRRTKSVRMRFTRRLQNLTISRLSNAAICSIKRDKTQSAASELGRSWHIRQAPD